jgi:hypothetical protein
MDKPEYSNTNRIDVALSVGFLAGLVGGIILGVLALGSWCPVCQ